MGDYPVKKNVARTFLIPGFVSRANTMLFQVNPTLATGDVQYSIDGGTWTNLSTTPDVYPAGGTQVRLQMSQAEMNGDQINIRWSDAAGEQWCDGSLAILTSTLQTGDIAAAVWAYATRTITSGQITVNQIWDELTSGHTTPGSIIKLIVDYLNIAVSTRQTLGAGSTSTPITVTDGTNPVANADVWASTSSTGSNVVARGYTNAFGVVTFMLDPGTYYIWISLPGYDFAPLPKTQVVT